MYQNNRNVVLHLFFTQLVKQQYANAVAIPVVFTVLMLLACDALGKEAFEAVQCHKDIPSILIGNSLPKGRVVEIEAKYSLIYLRHTGGQDISDSLHMSGWSICGNEYQLLVDLKNSNIVRDAVLFVHSRRQPAFYGICETDGKKMTAPVLAVLDIPNYIEPPRHYYLYDTTLAPVIDAWKIDDSREKFIKIPVNNIRCSRAGIFTIDGGP